MSTVLLLLALLGHGFLWIGLVNRLHAVGIRRRTIKRLTLVMFVLAAIIPLAIAGWFLGKTNDAVRLSFDGAGGSTFELFVAVYGGLCAVVGLVTLVRLVVMRWLQWRPVVVRYQGTKSASINWQSAAQDDSETRHHAITRLPLNEILRLQVTERAIELPRLPKALDGLSIVHLSDWHYTGRIGKSYFREVVRVSNELEPDLVAITGDLVDSAECVEWMDNTLGQLTARYGVYFILGNHDLRVDSVRLRQLLVQQGLVDLGGQRKKIEILGETIFLAGNERPWFKHAGDQAGLEIDRDGEAVNFGSGLRVVLSHSPDQLGWARARGADLMLAGHTHGGQICIPPLGALFSPSARGVRYISGVYHVPPTVLHISRGLSSDLPVRWRCPPELVRLELRAR